MEKKKPFSNILKLFLNNLYISSFTFGGGMAIVSIMKKRLVDELHWIDEEEMLDYIAMAQATPGVIAVNTAILVGWKVGGFLGMAVSVLATILPPMVIIFVVSIFYQAFVHNPYVALALKGMQAGVAAVILDVVIKLAFNVLKLKNPLHWIIMPVTFVVSFILKVNVAFIIIGAAVLGIIAELITHKEREK